MIFKITYTLLLKVRKCSSLTTYRAIIDTEGKKLIIEQLKIRAEAPADYNELFHLHYTAFGEREDESRLSERIRESQEFISELSLVALTNDLIVGHALFSKAMVVNNDTQHEVIILAPIGVKPEFQKQGVGSALIRKGLKIAKELNYSHVFLIGHPTYYPKFGFEPARPHGFELIQFNVPNEVFMVAHLREDVKLDGELRYPDSFFL